MLPSGIRAEHPAALDAVAPSRDAPAGTSSNGAFGAENEIHDIQGYRGGRGLFFTCPKALAIFNAANEGTFDYGTLPSYLRNKPSNTQAQSSKPPRLEAMSSGTLSASSSASLPLDNFSADRGALHGDHWDAHPPGPNPAAADPYASIGVAPQATGAFHAGSVTGHEPAPPPLAPWRRDMPTTTPYPPAAPPPTAHQPPPAMPYQASAQTPLATPHPVSYPLAGSDGATPPSSQPPPVTLYPTAALPAAAPAPQPHPTAPPPLPAAADAVPAPSTLDCCPPLPIVPNPAPQPVIVLPPVIHIMPVGQAPSAAAEPARASSLPPGLPQTVILQQYELPPPPHTAAPQQPSAAAVTASPQHQPQQHQQPDRSAEVAAAITALEGCLQPMRSLTQEHKELRVRAVLALAMSRAWDDCVKQHQNRGWQPVPAEPTRPQLVLCGLTTGQLDMMFATRFPPFPPGRMTYDNVAVMYEVLGKGIATRGLRQRPGGGGADVVLAPCEGWGAARAAEVRRLLAALGPMEEDARLEARAAKAREEAEQERNARRRAQRVMVEASMDAAAAVALHNGARQQAASLEPRLREILSRIRMYLRMSLRPHLTAKEPQPLPLAEVLKGLRKAAHVDLDAETLAGFGAATAEDFFGGAWVVDVAELRRGEEGGGEGAGLVASAAYRNGPETNYGLHRKVSGGPQAPPPAATAAAAAATAPPPRPPPKLLVGEHGPGSRCGGSGGAASPGQSQRQSHPQPGSSPIPGNPHPSHSPSGQQRQQTQQQQQRKQEQQHNHPQQKQQQQRQHQAAPGSQLGDYGSGPLGSAGSWPLPSIFPEENASLQPPLPLPLPLPLPSIFPEPAGLPQPSAPHVMGPAAAVGELLGSRGGCSAAHHSGVNGAASSTSGGSAVGAGNGTLGGPGGGDSCGKPLSSGTSGGGGSRPLSSGAGGGGSRIGGGRLAGAGSGPVCRRVEELPEHLRPKPAAGTSKAPPRRPPPQQQQPTQQQMQQPQKPQPRQLPQQQPQQPLAHKGTLVASSCSAGGPALAAAPAGRAPPPTVAGQAGFSDAIGGGAAAGGGGGGGSGGAVPIVPLRREENNVSGMPLLIEQWGLAQAEVRGADCLAAACAAGLGSCWQVTIRGPEGSASQWGPTRDAAMQALRAALLARCGPSGPG